MRSVNSQSIAQSLATNNINHVAHHLINSSIDIFANRPIPTLLSRQSYFVRFGPGLHQGPVPMGVGTREDFPPWVCWDRAPTSARDEGGLRSPPAGPHGASKVQRHTRIWSNQKLNKTEGKKLDT